MVETYNVPEIRRATIRSYNSNGTVRVAIDEQRLSEGKLEYDNVNVPLAWSGPNGEMIAGFPPEGAPVTIKRGHGGEWFILSYLKSNNTFRNINAFGTGGIGRNIMSDFRPGRILMQTEIVAQGLQNKLMIDPNDGTIIGSANSFAQMDVVRNIASQNFGHQMSFTNANRSIHGIIERDLNQNELRDVGESILSSHEYSEFLTDIAMDPSNGVAFKTTGTYARNLPLVESREIVYEFANNKGFNFSTDSEESSLYQSNRNPSQQTRVLRTDSRTDVFNLNLHYPNHLMETVKGTAVDILGNILDLNRNVLPIGVDDEFSFNKNTDGNLDAFKKIRALHRKAIAFHFELNARKRTGDDDIFEAPDVLAKSDVTGKAPDHGRDRSRFFVDIDKEGQFKINIPASSETGNVPLLTRYETGTNILYAQGDIDNPNLFGRIEVDGEISRKDIFHDDFANESVVELSDLSPLDRFNDDNKVKYGTAYHNILNTCLQFQNREKGTLINYNPRSSLNDLDPIDTIVTDTIITSGEEANAGGRSGMINLDGFVSLNIGANTVDRQSLWLDTAGGIVANIGRDLRGRSYVAGYDGDILIQVGPSGIGNQTDSRFNNQNDGFRQPTVDLRVVQGPSQGSNGGQVTVFRIDQDGVKVASYGRVEIVSAQDMVFRSRGTMHFDAEEIVIFSGSPNQRRILRSGKEI